MPLLNWPQHELIMNFQMKSFATLASISSRCDSDLYFVPVLQFLMLLVSRGLETFSSDLDLEIWYFELYWTLWCCWSESSFHLLLLPPDLWLAWEPWLLLLQGRWTWSRWVRTSTKRLVLLSTNRWKWPTRHSDTDTVVRFPNCHKASGLGNLTTNTDT